MTLPSPDPTTALEANGSVDALAEVVSGRRTVVVTGAGISTDSGIPDYRGDGVDRRRAPGITYREFMRVPGARRRYWARSQAGFRHVGSVSPNAGHHAITRLQDAGLVRGLITQNVDRLHARAGSSDVLELHGRIDEVICTSCGDVRPRRELSDRLAEANPEYEALLDVVSTPFAPDGDADVAERLIEGFVLVDCMVCGGVLKPNVVFFGESMPRERRDRAAAMVDDSQALLVLGSSLAVMSGYRLVLRAAAEGTPIGIVTRGDSRGDHLAEVKVDGDLTSTLVTLVDTLVAQ